MGDWREESECVHLCVAENGEIKLWYCSGKLDFLDALEEIGRRLLLEELLLKSIPLTWKADRKGM